MIVLGGLCGVVIHLPVICMVSHMVVWFGEGAWRETESQISIREIASEISSHFDGGRQSWDRDKHSFLGVNGVGERGLFDGAMSRLVIEQELPSITLYW